MRRIAVLALSLVALAYPAAVEGARRSTHGFDPVAVDRLPELPLPTGLPTVWCGQLGATDDLEHETAPGVPKYHAIYALPSDGTDRSAAVATQLQVDALQASALLERSYGRAIRFDMGTSCGPEFLDISVVRLASSTAEIAVLAAQPHDELFLRVASDLRAAGFPLLRYEAKADEAAGFVKNFLVWLDGPAPELYCGQATVFEDPTRGPTNWNNYGGKLSLIFTSGTGFCNSNTVRHEIGHNLGALQPGASHTPDGAHCDDAYEDTMCLQNAPSRDSGEYNALFFDYGNDDYWDPPQGAPLGHWTVNLSRFLCADPNCNTAGGSSNGGFADRDGDALPDALDQCPDTTGSACAAEVDMVQSEPAYVRLRVVRRTLARGRVRLTISATGRGRALVTVRCGRRSKLRRSVNLPRRIRVRVLCRSRLKVTAKTLHTATGEGQ